MLKFLFFATLTCCTATETIYHLGDFLVNINIINISTTSITIHHQDRPSTPTFSTSTPFLSTSPGSFKAIEDSGNFRFTNIGGAATTTQTVVNVKAHCALPKPVYQGCDAITISGSLDNEATYTYTLYQNNDTDVNAIRFTTTVVPLANSFLLANSKDINSKQDMDASAGARLHLLWDLMEDEEIYGMGEQYTIHNLRHRTVPIVTTEQGVGRGKQPVSDFVNVGSKLHNAAGNWHTTYTAIPHYITNYMRSMFMDDTRYSEFNFESDNKCNYTIVIGTASKKLSSKSINNEKIKHVEAAGVQVNQKDVENADQNNVQRDVVEQVEDARWTVSGYVYHGTTPLKLIQQHTNVVGRMQPLADWVSTGKYSKRRSEHREWSTVVDIFIPPPFFQTCFIVIASSSSI